MAVPSFLIAIARGRSSIEVLVDCVVLGTAQSWAVVPRSGHREDFVLGLIIASSDDVDAVVMVDGPDDAGTRYATRFAEYLVDYRTRTGLSPGAPLICSTAPLVDERLIRIPHLVTFGLDANVQDRVIWELMTPLQARTWLGVTVPNQAAIEGSLKGLLALRRMARSDELRGDRRFGRVTALLEENYFSIRFVLQNFEAFEHAIDQLAE